MSKQEWQNHMKETGAHDRAACPDCKKRAKTRQANENAKAIRQVYSDLGMSRVRGSLGGVYYE